MTFGHPKQSLSSANKLNVAFNVVFAVVKVDYRTPMIQVPLAAGR
jgi:hypothetical protein